MKPSFNSSAPTMLRAATVLVAITIGHPGADAGSAQAAAHTSPLEEAQRQFYNGRYEQAAALTAEACASANDLVGCELRTSALLFRIKRLMGSPVDQDKAFKACAECQPILAAFVADVARGQAVARAQLEKNPEDETTLFYLGKLDLNYVWLQLGTLGRKTGWGEYWEARKSLDTLLKKNPAHVRARVARAWIDYIVDTKMPRGTRWLLGGGNKKRGLLAVREAAGAEADFFTRTEAMFALWDLQVRERQMTDAVVSAQRLVKDFPENEELRKFLEKHDGASNR